jgi:hypothetical protein
MQYVALVCSSSLPDERERERERERESTTPITTQLVLMSGESTVSLYRERGIVL